MLTKKSKSLLRNSIKIPYTTSIKNIAEKNLHVNTNTLASLFNGMLILSKFNKFKNEFTIRQNGSSFVYSLNTNQFTMAFARFDSINVSFTDIDTDDDGGLYVVSPLGNYIYYIAPNYAQSIVAGISPFSGDGGQAILAQVRSPTGMAFDSSGALYFTDDGNSRIRKVDTSGVISLVTSTSVNGPIFSKGYYSAPVANFQYGVTVSGGAGSHRYSVNLQNMTCFMFCRNLTTTYLPQLTTLSTPYTLDRGTGSLPGPFFSSDRYAEDGANKYAYLIETDGATWGNTRSYIYKQDSAGTFTRIAGHPTVSTASGVIAITDGQAVSNLTAGTAVDFYAAGGVIFLLQGSAIFTATEGGTWKQQVAGLSSGKFALNPADKSMYYRVGNIIRRKAYAADGSGAVTNVVDLTGNFSSITNNFDIIYNSLYPNTLFFTNQDSIYKYVNSSAIP